MANENSGFDTIALHGGWDGDPATMSKGVPIYRTGALPNSARPPGVFRTVTPST
jgi:O-acetylhomoserine/O-acetylserine sulfhydrylase-like pyridoxal-dependent enzyme